MSVSLDRIDWRGFGAWQMASERVSLVVIPAAGARIASLLDRKADFEWLITPEQSNPARAFAYGTEYNPNQSGGWDEMFPTILACPYPAPGPWHGLPLPDHGELWTLPWQDAGSGGGTIRLQVEGQALPYRLARSLSLPAANEVLFEYALTNLGEETLAYLWSAHPQFACEQGATILLPPEAAEVINVLPLEWGPEWGPAGTRNPWPESRSSTTGALESGARARQDVVAWSPRRGGRKFYLPPESPISWAGLRQAVAGCELRLGWDAAALPYCGVWIDEGFLNKVATVAIEPTTAYYDSLATAWANQRLAMLAPGASCSWQMSVTLNKVKP